VRLNFAWFGLSPRNAGELLTDSEYQYLPMFTNKLCKIRNPMLYPAELHAHNNLQIRCSFTFIELSSSFGLTGIGARQGKSNNLRGDDRCGSIFLALLLDKGVHLLARCKHAGFGNDVAPFKYRIGFMATYLLRLCRLNATLSHQHNSRPPPSWTNSYFPLPRGKSDRHLEVVAP
jgi:hypothetical protein